MNAFQIFTVTILRSRMIRMQMPMQGCLKLGKLAKAGTSDLLPAVIPTKVLNFADMQ